MENFVLPYMAACGIYIYVPYILNPESARKILRTQRKEMVILENSPWIRLDSDEENRFTACLFNSRQGRYAGVCSD